MTEENPLTIHEAGKIDIHKAEARLRVALDHLAIDDVIHPDNRELIRDFIRDCRLGKTVLKRKKKKIGAATCLKYLANFRVLSRGFGKSFQAVRQLDMEQFIERLESDELQTLDGRPYGDETKAGIKKAIRKFWKWKDGNGKIYPEIVEWIDTYVCLKEVRAITRDEIEVMIGRTGSPRDKALLMVLFDSGARAEELLNVRLGREHLFWKEQIGCYMIRLEYSKTKPRTISLPLSTKHLADWLKMHPGEGNPLCQLFPVTYGNLRMIVRRIGQRALGKRVTPHMLRHSSATFYANRLKSPYKLCYRYGWAMSSDMVNRYLDREGILEEDTPHIVREDSIAVANRESSGLKEELAFLKEAHSELIERHDGLIEEIEATRQGKGFMAILAGLKRQQEQMASALSDLTGQGFDVVLTSESGEVSQ